LELNNTVLCTSDVSTQLRCCHMNLPGTDWHVNPRHRFQRSLDTFGGVSPIRLRDRDLCARFPGERLQIWVGPFQPAFGQAVSFDSRVCEVCRTQARAHQSDVRVHAPVPVNEKLGGLAGIADLFEVPPRLVPLPMVERFEPGCEAADRLALPGGIHAAPP